MSDRILKKSFIGGFRKSDVLDYVEKLQSENLALADEAQAGAQVGTELSQVKAELEALIEENKALKNANEAMAEENAHLIARIEEIKSAADESDESKNGIIASLEAKCKELEAKCPESSEEAQPESDLAKPGKDFLIRDALRYSDSLVEKAKDTAQSVLEDAEGTVNDSILKAAEVTESFKNAQLNLDYSLNSVKSNLEELVSKLEGLSKELSTGD